MKLNAVASAILLTLPMSSVFADNLICKQITGNVSILTPDINCQIVAQEAASFPELSFVGAPGTCFTATITATLGGTTKLHGTAMSGLTQVDLGTGIGAATVISFKDANGYRLGKIYTVDSIVDVAGNTREQLAMVDGTRMFKNGRANLTIAGNALAGPTTFYGKLCAED